MSFFSERSTRSAGLLLLLLGVDVVQAVHAALVVLAADVEVEAEGGDGGNKSKKSKREKSLVDPADHDPGIFFPVRYIAVVLERRAHVPGQQAPADSPDQCKEAINRNVEIRSEADAAVQDDSHSQRCDGKERRCHEQHKRPRRLPVIVRQVPHEEAHDAADDQTGEKLAKAQEMERHSWIMRRRGLRATVKWLEHVGQGCVLFATDVKECVVAARALGVDIQGYESLLQRSTLLVWRF